MTKLEPEIVDGKATGKYVPKEASIIDVLNPTVAVDSSGAIVRALAFALLGRILS